MSSSPLTPIVSAFDLTTNYQVLFQAPTTSLRVAFDAAVFNNYSAGNVEYSVRLTQSGVSTVLNEIITDKTIRTMSPDLAPSLIGQAILSGGVIEAKASANSSVSVAITATIINDD